MSDLLTRTHRRLSTVRRLSRFQATARRAGELEKVVQEELTGASAAQVLARLRSQDRRDRAHILAVVRETIRQVLGIRLYDVQLVGALALEAGLVAEMATGEGKTITIVPAVVLGLLRHSQVHVVTANPYLAQRDHVAMAPVYEALGLVAGLTEPGASIAEKQAAYQADVVYGTNSEFGFDYLRSNTAESRDGEVQGTLPFAIVDEVDSVLIDDARTPLILSTQVPANDAALRQLARIATMLQPDVDVELDFKRRTAALTDFGYARFEQGLVEQGFIPQGQSLYAAENLWLLSAAHQATNAQFLYRRDRQYVLKGAEVVIVDESTGRAMAGRRWEGGLHQAVEAKEGVPIAAPTVTLASITYQDFFGRYAQLAGLTGTALTAADEFEELYGLSVLAIPTHRPVARIHEPDRLYPTRKAKRAAVVQEVAARHATGQPVLIGTSSVDESERISRLLSRAGIAHQVLNARQDAEEAAIVARAGRLGAVTVATSMAGRGTDILLAGEKPSDDDPQALARWEAERQQLLELGGLCVIGTERAESRRIDDQLRGRCGRQGDVGVAIFFLSLEDDLLRHFGGRNARVLGAVSGMSEDQAFSGAIVDRFVARAQAQAELRSLSARKEVLKFDKTISEQREAVFALRHSLLDSVETAREFARERVEIALEAQFAPLRALDVTQWDLTDVRAQLDELGLKMPLLTWVHGKEPMDSDDIVNAMVRFGGEHVEGILPKFEGPELQAMLALELRRAWVEQLSALEELSRNVIWSAQLGRNPGFVFSERAGELFEGFVHDYAAAVTRKLLGQESAEEETRAAEASSEVAARLALERALFERPVRRNEPCPCGSGRRFKACHGQLP